MARHLWCKLGFHKFIEFASKKGVGTMEKCQHCDRIRTWLEFDYLFRIQEAQKEITDG